MEAITHFTSALELLKTLPDTPARARQELTLYLSLGASLFATKGYGDTEVEQTYTRARELCLQVGEPLQVARVLFGLWSFNTVRGNHTAARALGEQSLPITQQQQDATLSLVAQAMLGATLHLLGEFTSAHSHLAQAGAFYNPEHHGDLASYMGLDPGAMALGYAAKTLWYRGFPDQALEQARYALSVAQVLSHPFSVAEALRAVAFVHLFRREGQEAQAQADALLTLVREHGLAEWLAIGPSVRGWAFVERALQSRAQEQRATGLGQLREGLTAMRATGTGIYVPLLPGVLAQDYAQDSQVEEGLRVIAEALAMVERNEERWAEAELYRIKGTLTLGARGWGLETSPPSSQVPSLKPLVSNGAEQEAEGYFLKAIEIARKQQAKSWELRATTSLARLWQSQSKHAEARQRLAEIYGWFTEGFDTKDLQEAKALIEELSD